MKKGFLLIFMVTSAIGARGLPDFDKKIQPFILEEKQLIIPGYPDAFNPSLIRWYDGRLLLSFRTREPLTHSSHLMGFVWLNEDFEPEGEPRLLSIYEEAPLKTSRAQDPRLIRVGDAYYIVYNNILSNEDLETRRMLVARLHYEDDHFYIIKPQYLLDFKGDKKNWREKNWSPFEYQGKLFFSYSLNPHRVFMPSLLDGKCETGACTMMENFHWKWGELRGGTPAVLDHDHYIGFFHSFMDMASVQSKGKIISHYFMGAYCFNSKFPFALTHMSPEPIVGKTFYGGPDYPTWKPLKAIFPGGIMVDEKYVWVVYGRQDYEAWVVKMDKEGVIKSLVPVAYEKDH